MKKRFLNTSILFPILLAGISVLLCVLNFTPNTWLSGWDTLHPEFNFLLNFQRIFNGVWRQEQGLGALSGHAQMSELPRIIFLWISSLVLPVNFLRYFFFFVCLVLGPLGIYFYLVKNSSKKITSFLGGLFYLLNLGTLQHFLVPFEMFATLYAFLPWLLLFAGKFLDLGEKKHLLWFVVLTIISSPMAYASVLWFSYLVFLLFFILVNVLLTKGKVLKKGIILVLITVVLNVYWLLPNLYFMATSAKEVAQAKINLMFSERAFLTDEKYANLTDVSLLKGFLFDWQKYDNGKFNFLLKTWREYLALPGITIVGYFIFSFVLLGLLSAIFKKERKGLLILPGFFFSFLFLIHGAPGIEIIFTFLRNHLDIFKEGLRFPWTKFSIFVMFGYSVFFALGIEEILRILKNKKIITISFSVLMGILLVIWMLPAFKGNLISEQMRIKIPKEYFDMYSWFNEQPADKRIALLPATNFWGWEYYRFGFEGAGFVWFGLKQPILVRDFDRWQPENENFYWEISYAIYSKNEKLLENAFQKYQVSYIMLDGNVLSPSWPMALNTSEIDQTLSSIPMFKLENTFGNIKIYKVNLQAPVKDFVWVESGLPVINSYGWGNEDKAYGEYGNYISFDNSKIKNQKSKTQLKSQNFGNDGNDYDIYYPFRILFTGRTSEDLDFEIEDKGDHFIFKKKLPTDLQNYDLLEPEYISSAEDNYFVPRAEIINGNIEVNVPEVSNLTTIIDPFYAPAVLKAENCNQFSKGEVKVTRLRQGCLLRRSGYEGRVGGQGSLNNGAVRLEATDATNCSAAFYLPELLHKYGYLISIESKNISGKSLLFWVENLTNRKADMELYLSSLAGSHPSWLIQPPMASDGLGYTLHFDNVSIGREKTVNELGKITVNPIPYEYLMKIKLVSSIQYQVLRGGLNVLDLEGLTGLDLKVNHPNSSVYEVEINGAVGENETLVLSQAYHEGWKAYKITNCELRIANLFPFLCGKELWHVKVNNWENGWQLVANNSQQTTVNYQQLEVGSRKLEVEKQVIILFFWPQYLEYAGFVIFIGALVSILLYNNHHK